MKVFNHFFSSAKKTQNYRTYFIISLEYQEIFSQVSPKLLSVYATVNFIISISLKVLKITIGEDVHFLVVHF